MNLRRLLTRLVMFGLLIGSGFYLIKNLPVAQDLALVQEAARQTDQLQGSVKGVSDSVVEQTGQLAEKSKAMGEHISQVLGAYIQPTNNETEHNADEGDEQSSRSKEDQNQSSQASQNSAAQKPIYEETFEYGRYLYCQQVIKDYETQH